MTPPGRQRGLAAAALVVAVILAVLVLVLGRGAFQREEEVLDQRGTTDARMRKVTDSLVAFVVLNGRLPCPARGDDGVMTDADPTSANAADKIGRSNPETATSALVPCATPDGVVPWKTIALRSDDALDGWNRKISYRVFADAATGLTQDGGANMTNCNGSLWAPLDVLDANSLCKPGAPPPNKPDQFYAARGAMLVVEDSGTTRNGNAFVLVSHGETGHGAYPAEGATARNTLPAGGGREFTNTQAGGTYWILPRKSLPDTPATDAAHFDDIVAYLGASELVSRARLAPRPWTLTTQLNAAAVEAAAPGFDHTSSQNTQQTAITLGGYLVMASSTNPGMVTIGFREQDSIGGIGVIGNGSSSGDLNSAFEERLTFQLGADSGLQKTSLALNAFQILDFSPFVAEQAEISFWRAGELLQASVVRSWDSEEHPTRCLFETVPGAVFDRVDVRPRTRFGDGGSSRFTVAAIKSCSEQTASCTVDVADAVSNGIPVDECPSRPPGAATAAPTGVGATGATLQGFVSANGAAATTFFEYGTTTSYGSSVAGSPGTVATGTGAITAAITGLSCGTTYHARALGQNAGGVTVGNDLSFTTPAC